MKWIHTLILTDIADSESLLIGAVVSRPAQQELMASGGDVERSGNVTTQSGQGLTVDCRSLKHRQTDTHGKAQ